MDQFENREQENRQAAQPQNQPQDEPQVQYYADGKLTNDKEQLFTGQTQGTQGTPPPPKKKGWGALPGWGKALIIIGAVILCMVLLATSCTKTIDKVADKLNVISNLLEKCDTLVIGGGMAYTFLKAKGYEVGTSLVDDEKIGYCSDMMAKAEKEGKKLLLPVDCVITDRFPDPIDAKIEVRQVPVGEIPADMQSLDIGDQTRALYAQAIKGAKTVIWNGPMGVFENPILAGGTIAGAKAMAVTELSLIRS